MKVWDTMLPAINGDLPAGTAMNRDHERMVVQPLHWFKSAAALIAMTHLAAVCIRAHTGDHAPENECWPGIIRFLGFDLVCPDPKTVPEKIAYVCRHKGISRAVLAKLLGVDKATVLKWEHGGRPRNGHALNRLVDELRTAETLPPERSLGDGDHRQTKMP